MSSSTKSQRRRINEEKQEQLKAARHTYKFRPKTDKQGQLFEAMIRSPLSIAVGPAGTGKSFVGCSAAVKLLEEGFIDTIVLTRNPLPTGTSLGFFAGSDAEKMAVWLAPVISTLKKILKTPNNTDGYFDYLVRNGHIVMQPMETVKGSSFDRAFIIVEEAQECDMEQLKNLCTRPGEGSFVFLNGDTRQSNSKLRCGSFDKLVGAIKEENGHSRWVASEDWDKIEIPVVEFTKDDCVRSGVVRKMLSVFDKYEL